MTSFLFAICKNNFSDFWRRKNISGSWGYFFYGKIRRTLKWIFLKKKLVSPCRPFSWYVLMYVGFIFYLQFVKIYFFPQIQFMMMHLSNQNHTVSHLLTTFVAAAFPTFPLSSVSHSLILITHSRILSFICSAPKWWYF